MDSQFSQTNSMLPITINTVNNQIINMYPSQNSVNHPMKSPKRKRIPSTESPVHGHYASPVSLYDLDNTIPEFRLVTDTDIPNGKSKLDVRLVRDWRQIGNSWSERVKGWSQQENYWYMKLHAFYIDWSNDPNSNKSTHPDELSWAYMKLSQAMREVAYCKEWIAYAKWQVASRAGQVKVGGCPPLPSVEGRPSMVDKDRKLEENGNDKQVGAGVGGRDPTGGLSHKTLVQSPTQALRARTRDSPQEVSLQQQGKAPFQPPSRDPTYPRTPVRTPILAPVTPSKAPDQVSQFSAQDRIRTPRTPTRGSTKAPPRPHTAAKDPTKIFDHSPSRSPVQAPAPLRRARTQSSVRGPIQAPAPAPFQSTQVPQISQAPQAPIYWQQCTNTQNPSNMPFLSFPEFVAQRMTGQQQDWQSARQPIQCQQPVQQSTQQPTRKLGRPLIQKPTQQPSQKPTQQPSQQPSQLVGRPVKKPTQKGARSAVHQATNHGHVQHTPSYHTVHKEIPLHRKATASVTPREKPLPICIDLDPQIPVSLSTPCIKPTEMKSEISTPTSDWWDTWVLEQESEMDADCVRFQGEELEKLMEDLAGPEGVEGSVMQVQCP